MGYFPVRYDSRVVIYERKMFIRLVTDVIKKLFWGCCHSSVDSSVPTILPPQVRVPSTPSTLLSFIVKLVPYLSREKNEINKKRPGLAHFFFKKLVELPTTPSFVLGLYGSLSSSIELHKVYKKQDISY